MTDRLPRLQQINSEFWIDEAIWGHRLYDEQTPWLCIMEFLNVFNAEFEEERALIEQNYNTLSYQPKHRMYLRNILFNNPHLEIVKEKELDDHSSWKAWVENINNYSVGIGNPDFSYLEERFSSFKEFAEVVDFLRSSTIEGENNKRWSSQFIFPFGPNCLYEDVGVKGERVSNDRRFFGRTGELLYLMLSRSSYSDELREYIAKRLLNQKSKFNRLVAQIQPQDQNITPMSVRSGAYLPYVKLEDYDRIARDWITLFECDIPTYDVLPHLVNITGLHLLIYLLKRGKEIFEGNTSVTFVLEILAPKKTIIRDVSTDSYSQNNNITKQAITAYITSVMDTDKWKELKNSEFQLEGAGELLFKEFAWPDQDELAEQGFAKTPDELVNELVNKAQNRHKQHVNNFHRVWGREIGLSSSRGSRRIRYAPTDSFLKTLVLCIVPKRMEFQEFLEELYKRYGFIIGDRQAKDFLSSGQADQESFSDNAVRLEQRLSSMGLLNRLSDACAYVENPFAKDEEV